ncbi:DUF3667 domain-containing protein [Actomonas aquatica]|uniref:DUF3667 domain-containing protein n=1 Tax=Actomonas aquatica TaxID=2866162 RepID=A0ABZ1CGU0_9BACT|nr:DUF3667 domain-containing protein [Opitutus sp. WL0086]WRQ89799.1 DUF3667 domain-containing protein [Opitutus sp. WL0086]
MLSEAAESFFHLDGRFARGVVYLLFLPGRLTRSFLLGRRASQVPPLRFYLFITLVYFLSLPLRTTLEMPELPAGDLQQGLKELPQDIVVADNSEEAEDLSDFIAGLQEGMTNERGESLRLPTRDEVIELVLFYGPKVLFVLLPLLALSTRVLFWRSGFAYLEHLVVALHIGAFYFTFLLFAGGWVGLLELIWSPLAGLAQALAFTYAALYVPLLFAEVFRKGIWGTLWRTGVLFTAAFCIFLVVVVSFSVVLVSQLQLDG